MKSAEEHARAAARYLFANERVSSTVVFPELARMFKEYARDQRHMCAAAVQALDAGYEGYGIARVQRQDAAEHLRADAHAAVMNTPFPGEA